MKLNTAVLTRISLASRNDLGIKIRNFWLLFLLSDIDQNKNAFQQDTYCPLQWPSCVCVCVCVCVSQHTLGRGCVSQHALGRGVYPSVHWAGGGLAKGVCVSAQRVVSPGVSATPPVNRITDACEKITLPQLRCGR